MQIGLSLTKVLSYELSALQKLTYARRMRTDLQSLEQFGISDKGYGYLILYETRQMWAYARRKRNDWLIRDTCPKISLVRYMP